MHPDVAAYLESAPEDQRAVLHGLHDRIVRELPDAEPSLPNGFPVWSIDGRWCCGFATRKKGPMLYVMAPGVLDRHADRLGKLRSGRSCVEFRATDSMTLAELEGLADLLCREAREALES